MKLKIRKNDRVIVISGKDKGKKGVVLQSFPKLSKVLVSGVNIAKKHIKPSANYNAAGIIEKEMPIHISNVMHEDPKLGLPVRVGYKFLENGQKVRYSKRSGEIIDEIS